MNKKVIAVMVAAGVALASSASVFAFQVNRAGSVYIAPSIGAYIPDTSRNLEKTVTGDLAVGYNINNYFAVQAVASFMPTRNDSTNKKVSANFFRVEGVYNIPMRDSNFVPFILAGAGGLHGNSGHTAYDLGVGTHYYIAPKVSFVGAYRWIHQPDNSRNDSMVTIGVSWAFGGSSSTPMMATTKSTPAKNDFSKSKYAVPKNIPKCNPEYNKNGISCMVLNGNKLSIHLDVKFAVNRSNITAMYSPAVESLGKFLSAHPSVSTKILGYTSNTGTKAYNQNLSVRRADAVKQYLVNHAGVSADRIGTQGLGLTNPIATNETSAGRALNRRVEANITAPLKTA